MKVYVKFSKNFLTLIKPINDFGPAGTIIIGGFDAKFFIFYFYLFFFKCI